MYLQNKYTNVYFSIITQAKARNLVTRKQAKIVLGYTELHHIIPKCLGGDNSKENTIYLTAREHFICHWLLIKMVRAESKHRMIYALRMMRCNNKNHGLNRYETKITSRVYAKLKEQFIMSAEQKQKMSIARTGKKHSIESIEKMSISKKNMSAETKKKMSLSWKDRTSVPGMLGKHHSDETKIKLSIANIGKNKGKVAWNKNKLHPCAELTRQKISIANKGIKKPAGFGGKISMAMKGIAKPKFACPCCAKLIGGASNFITHQKKCQVLR